ncbi:MAG: transposase [Gomphosphaeria aponina SAG 52.96 = DSM 107014]|uniref:Transposase n=1 Tax=Gomphosphaeria aponina SAG 52.96 = DSM 107014 TaxID=1521640 RepID=A0A941GN88_9CHRO|nr:transposase [Gomphosphaeria aponina SAG 52.96 = DSM 107014]
MYAIKLELKLNNKERTKLAQHAGYSRFVYNYALGLYNQLDHQEFKQSASKKLDTIKKLFTNYRKKEKESQWCNKLSSRVYQNAFIALKNAFSRFFKGISGYPKFKRKKNNCSFTVDSSNGKVLLPAGKKIKIPTMGTFRLKEALRESYVSQTFTISKIADKWYVSLAVEAEKIPPLYHEIIKPIGIDLGVKTFATLSDGSKIESPMPYRKAKTKLADFQFQNRKKQLGNRKLGIKTSHNARKYLKKLAKKSAKVANVRADFLQKTTTNLCKKYAHLRIENLNIKGMMANHKLAGAIADLGAYEFKRQLFYKAECFGTKVDVIDQWYPSSKGCSNCGAIKSNLTLSDRIFKCDECAFEEDRDFNASIRLEKAPEEAVVNRVGYTRINACGQVRADSLGRNRK